MVTCAGIGGCFATEASLEAPGIAPVIVTDLNGDGNARAPKTPPCGAAAREDEEEEDEEDEEEELFAEVVACAELVACDELA